jgi:transposase
VRAAIEQAGAFLRFLPPYSPDFNPIELTFRQIEGVPPRRTTPHARAGSVRSWPSPSGCSRPMTAPTTSGTAAIDLLHESRKRSSDAPGAGCS